MSLSPVLLELKQVSKRFGAVTAVNDLSFSIADGEVLGVMGPNGSGKTTLLNLIMGVYPLDRGEIRFSGVRINGLPTDEISRFGVGRTYQIPQPFQRMTVLENLMVGDLFGGNHQSLPFARANALSVLKRVGLSEKAESEAGKLGLLDLKRLELGRALSVRPRLLLLDEIAAGLTAGEISALQRLIGELKREGQTILLIEHVLKVMFDLSDRILVLNFGERIAEGTPVEIASDPEVHKIYLGIKKMDEGVDSGPLGASKKAAVSPTGLLDVRNVNAAYGDFQALFNVSLDILEGEIVTLIGVNGAGKSTVIRVINRELPLLSGDILFRNKNIVPCKVHDIIGLGIAQCIEGRKLFPTLSVQENLDLGAYCRRAREKRNCTAEYVYKLFPILAKRRDQIARTLSGGEQQMLAIGRALMALPQLIMFDEISLGLAPVIIEDLYRAIVEINRQGTTILLVEQNVHLSLTIAHRAYVIERGRIVLSGNAAALRQEEQVKEVYFGL
jgi:branched-chain amino acid transport system ATP-binding protein